MKFVSSLRTRDLLKMLDFLPAAWETGGIRRLGSETVDTSERIIHYYMRPQKNMAVRSMLYLNCVWVLLRNIRVVGVLWKPPLILLAVGDNHRGQLVSLVWEQELRPLGTKRTCQLGVQVHHLWSEEHLRLLLLLQYEGGQE